MNHSATQTQRDKTRKAVTASLLISGALLLVASVGVGTATVLDPQQAGRVFGGMKSSVQGITAATNKAITGELPTVRLSGAGGQPELDECDGSFTRMTGYETSTFSKPVWAAHDACGGDTILSWKEGQQVELTGDENALYEVVTTLTVTKTWSTTDEISNLSGDVILQTCTYGNDEMRFVALKRLR